MRSLACLFVASCLLSVSAASAHAVDITFNAQAQGSGGSFTTVLDSPLTIGDATFTGGELLRHEVNGIDATGVYATSNLFGGNYTNPIDITFASAVRNFTVDITNNLAGFFTVSDNLGGSMTQFLLENQTTTFSLRGTGITSVTIAQAGRAFDFAIDNVHYTQPTSSPVPEPSSIALLGTGIVGAAASLRRRLFNRL